MKYLIRGQKIEITGAIKDYVESKISRLDKYFENSNEIEANVLIKVVGRDQIIEVTIPTKHFILRNEVADQDLYAAIDKIIDKLERQIRKNKEKINKKINKTIIKDFDYDLVDEYSEDEFIVKRKNIALKPIDEEEAIIQMEMLGHSFFAFKDIKSGKICILYKRKNGNYGIIETE